MSTTATKIQAAEDLCARKGLKLTPLRRDVLTLMINAAKPLKAYDLIRTMGTPDDPVQPPTVYRVLEFLQDAGLVHKVESLNAFVCCTDPGHTHHEHFLVCDRCGKIEEHTPQNASHVPPAQIGSFRIEHSVTELHGTCDLCQSHPK